MTRSLFELTWIRCALEFEQVIRIQILTTLQPVVEFQIKRDSPVSQKKKRKRESL